MKKQIIFVLFSVACIHSQLFSLVQPIESNYFQRLVRLPNTPKPIHDFAQEVVALPEAQKSKVIESWFQALDSSILEIQNAPNTEVRSDALRNFNTIFSRVEALKSALDRIPMPAPGTSGQAMNIFDSHYSDFKAHNASLLNTLGTNIQSKKIGGFRMPTPVKPPVKPPVKTPVKTAGNHRQ